MKIDSYAGQAVMITGAASGFGALLASELAAMGARVALGDLNVDALERVAAPLRAAGADVIAQRCDVRVEAEVAALVQAAAERFGRLDVGINNAGIAPPMKALIDTDEADLDLSFAVNAKGVFFGMKHQIRQMLAQRSGVILNVASMAGFGGAPKLAAYAASKHAVVGHEDGGDRICTPRHSRECGVPVLQHDADGHRQRFRRSQDFRAGPPMKRLGRPEEIVATMLTLCAQENTYLTGQAVAVDGGVSAF